MTSAAPPPRHERTRQVAVRAGATAALVSVLVFTGTGHVLATGIQSGENPTANVEPSPNFLVSGPCTGTTGGWHCANPCVTSSLHFPAYSAAPACDAYVLQALAAAWATEHLGPITLPSDFASLTAQEQLFVLADLERTARGLPPYLGLNAALSAEAQQAASADADPGVAPGFAVGVDRQGDVGYGGAFGSGFTTLGADFFWMYADGWGGSPGTTSNLACTSPTAKACWAHRDELLGADPGYDAGVGLGCADCEMGTGFVEGATTSSFVDLVERPAGAAPSMTFTWADDVVPYLPPSRAIAAREALRHRVEVRRAAVHAAWPQWSTPARATSPCLADTERPFAPLACRAKTFKRAGTVPVADKEER